MHGGGAGGTICGPTTGDSGPRPCAAAITCAFLLPVSTGGGTRRVRSVRKEGQGVSGQYGRRDKTCPVSTGGGTRRVRLVRGARVAPRRCWARRARAFASRSPRDSSLPLRPERGRAGVHGGRRAPWQAPPPRPRLRPRDSAYKRGGWFRLGAPTRDRARPSSAVRRAAVLGVGRGGHGAGSHHDEAARIRGALLRTKGGGASGSAAGGAPRGGGSPAGGGRPRPRHRLDPPRDWTRPPRDWTRLLGDLLGGVRAAFWKELGLPRRAARHGARGTAGALSASYRGRGGESTVG